MSTTKLIINKYENDSHFKSLNVIIEDGFSEEVTFGDWTDGRNKYKKNTEKSARLVVKIVSGDEYNTFNLDSCAREIDDEEKLLCTNGLFAGNSRQMQDLNGYKHFLVHENTQENSLINKYITQDIDNLNDDKIHEGLTYRHTDPDMADGNRFVSPLEHSLEKVKENNARIMENIHLLNRTLNYTKKKEILDIVCPKSLPSYPCNTCGKCFVYETGLRRHYSMRHALTSIQPRWQVVWTCIQCFQVWPSRDQAMKHAVKCCKSENQEYVTEIKTSLLLQCEFCEKVYTSIPRLLRHFKIHTTTRNYECNACGHIFLSYKTAEQHWITCPWLKVYYCFSLPKLLLCNACDRKFRNYDQLYNHRYKFCHFMAKMHNNEGNINSVGTLVYQCEICSLWYLSPLLLKAHRTQSHPHSDEGAMDKSFSQEYNTNENEFLID